MPRYMRSAVRNTPRPGPFGGIRSAVKNVPRRPRKMGQFGDDPIAHVPPAYGLRRRYPGASALMHPSDINRQFGPHPSDASRQGFIPKEQALRDPQVRMDLLRRFRASRRSGNRMKGLG